MASTVLPNGIIIPEKFSRDWYADLYHNWQELDNLLGGGTPKDGTLTIQKNGTTVGTFSANQATDETINIGVPTKTSDLTNDSGFITSDNTKIPLAGSNQISGDLVPSTDGTVNLGSVSYQWNNAYIKSLTINGVACGDILTHNVSEFVDVTNNQTIGGTKRFKAVIIRNEGNFTANEAPTTQTSCMVLRHTNNDGTHSANTILSYMFNTGETMCELTQIPCIGSLARTWFRTNTDGSYSIYSYTKNGALGTSSYKWKDVQTEKINGINPGALSLPSSTYINVDTTNWDLTCQNELLGSFTPTADGWLMLHIANSGSNEVAFWIIGGVIRINNKSSINTADNNNFNMFTIPVEKNVTYNIYGNASEYVAGRSIRYCRFMPCCGNV